MRCPKCGFISFDHLEECLKCKKNIKSASDTLKGTVYNIAPPAFLLFEEKTDETGSGSDFEPSPRMETESLDEIALDEEFVDSDLDILVPDEEEEEELEVSLENEQDGPEIDLGGFEEPADDDEGGEIEIDMTQFEDSFPGEPTEETPEEEIAIDGPDESFELSIPEELDDITDLEPPAASVEAAPEAPVAAMSDVEPPSADLQQDTSDIDLDDLDFDLGLDGLDGSPASVDSQSPVMDLDDIDFSDALTQADSDQAKEKSSIMDDDLDFELDLGGLSLKKDK